MLSFLSLSNLSFEKHGPCEITSLGDTQQVEALLITVTLLSSHCDYFSVIFLPVAAKMDPIAANQYRMAPFYCYLITVWEYCYDFTIMHTNDE